MKPIAHARRWSPRSALSRHAVDVVVVGYPVPTGIPVLFLAPALAWSFGGAIPLINLARAREQRRRFGRREDAK